MRVMELGDFSVTYRVSGFLKEVKHLITARSRLHAQVLDALHAGGVEIVSPTFMNQRVLAEDRRFVADPALRAAPARDEASGKAAEDIAFDKAERAALREQLRQRRELLVAARSRMAEAVAGVESAEEQERLEGRAERLDRQIERLELALAEEPAERE